MSDVTTNMSDVTTNMSDVTTNMSDATHDVYAYLRFEVSCLRHIDVM